MLKGVFFLPLSIWHVIFFQILLDIFLSPLYNIICSHIALSPNGKALDSDSSIFQVRILVALLERLYRFCTVFFVA